jgi:two-component system sensor histidine kinase GlrK
MRHLSFRLTLLLGFLLVSLLLGAAAGRGLLVLERFADESRSGAAQAVQMTTDIQQLAERSVDLERSARQYLVLQEPALHARFADLLAQAERLLNRVQANGIESIDGVARGWRQSAQEATRALAANDGDAALAALARIGLDNARLATLGRQWIDAHNGRLLEDLERNRRGLMVQVLAAVVAALLIAVGIAWWLLRPVSALEVAIERLGAGRFGEAVEIRGPEDLQRLGRRLNWLRQRLAELESDRVRVLRHVSHELKTPLAAMCEGVALLQEQVIGPLSDDQREVAAILEHNTRSLQRQIEALLDYHATVFDAGHLKRRRVALRDLLQAATDAQQLQLKARGLRVRIDAERRQAWVDPEKLGVALGNLLSNAIVFSPDGGDIRLSARVAGSLLTIDCIDAGPGVAVADAERIFEPFVQGHGRPESAPPGSGVGLSIVRELVAAHGGRVYLVPGGSGAHFRMELPYEQ